MHKAETNEHDNARARAAVVLAHFLWAPGSGAGTVDRQGSCTPTSEHAFGKTSDRLLERTIAGRQPRRSCAGNAGTRTA